MKIDIPITIPEDDSPDGSTFTIPTDVPEHIQPDPIIPPLMRKGEIVFAFLPISLKRFYSLECLYHGQYYNWGGEINHPVYGWVASDLITEAEDEENKYLGWAFDAEAWHFRQSGFALPVTSRTSNSHISLGDVPYGGSFFYEWGRIGMETKLHNSYVYDPPMPVGVERNLTYEEWGVFYREIPASDDDFVIMTPVFAALLLFGAAVCINSAGNVPTNRTRRIRDDQRIS